MLGGRPSGQDGCAFAEELERRIGAEAVDLRRIHADEGMQRGASIEVDGIGLAGLVPGAGNGSAGGSGGVGCASAASMRPSQAATRS